MPRKITIQSGPDPRTVTVGDETPKAPGGTDPETGKTETVDEAVDRMSGDTPNRTNQSSDHQNQY